MEDFSYFAKSKIGAGHIMAVAKQMGYKTSFVPKIDRVNIEFKYHYQGKEWEAYWYITKYDVFAVDDEVIGEAEVEALEKLHPQATFYGGFWVLTMPKLITFLEELMKQYGGWTLFASRISYKWYSLEDIREATRLYPDMEMIEAS
jgi:hypothetical protein